MTERNNSFDSSYLERIGLFRKGEHNDTNINAIAPSGEIVKINVYPLKVEGGTMFVPLRGQNELSILFPRLIRKI